jgi:3-hydroxybutyrate dehydrogenase
VINLSGKTAIVTGSTSGIGKAIASQLAHAGANVMINGFGDSAEIARLLKDLSAASGQTIQYSPADMRKSDEIKLLVDQTTASLGAVDILINNAGIQYVSPVEDFPPEQWDAILDINLTSSFHTTRLCLGAMKRAGWGRIINIASAHSTVASPYKSAYVAAKHGLLGLTKTVALECATDGVTVNAVSPGYVLTALVERQIPDTAKARGLTEEAVKNDVMLASQPTKKFVAAEDIAKSVLFLCSSGADNITGSNLAIDGGWTAH